MFTKYSGVEIPKNYNGSRFRQATIETEMKTHKAQGPMPVPFVKTSASPSFQSIIDQRVSETIDTDNAVEDNIELVNNESQEIAQEQEAEARTFPQLLRESGISKLFDNIKSDDLLLIALIFLLSDSNNEGNKEITLLLLLLLLYH